MLGATEALFLCAAAADGLKKEAQIGSESGWYVARIQIRVQLVRFPGEE